MKKNNHFLSFKICPKSHSVKLQVVSNCLTQPIFKSQTPLERLHTPEAPSTAAEADVFGRDFIPLKTDSRAV